MNYRLISVSVSFGCEIIRWAMQRGGVDFIEEKHVPLFYLVRTLPLRAGKFVPVVIAGETVWQNVPGILAGLDARLPPDRNIYGSDIDERLANQALLEKLVTGLSTVTAQYFYSYLLPKRSVMFPLMIDGAPWWERTLLRFTYLPWRIIIAKAMQISPAVIAAAPRQFQTWFDLLESELSKRARPFFGGAAPAGVDICIAGLMASFVLPAQFDGAAPTIDQLPEDLYRLVQQSRQRPAGVYILKVYEHARSPVQPR